MMIVRKYNKINKGIFREVIKCKNVVLEKSDRFGIFFSFINALNKN